jgi:cell division protein FtsL
MVLLALLLTLGSLLYLWQWMNYLQVSYDVQNLEKEHQQMSTRLEMLGVEIDYLSRPQRIETIAREQMLMGLPHPSQIYTLEEYAAHVAAQP